MLGGLYFGGPAATDGSRALGPGLYLCKLGADPIGTEVCEGVSLLLGGFCILHLWAATLSALSMQCPCSFKTPTSLTPTQEAKTAAASSPSIPCS